MEEQQGGENVISRQEGIKACSPQAEGREGNKGEWFLAPVLLS